MVKRTKHERVNIEIISERIDPNSLIFGKFKHDE